MAEDNKKVELTEEQKQQINKSVTDISTKLGEIFSQCWESEEFKKAFIEEPTAIFDEYNLEYDSKKEYKIIDSPEKTIVHVLPYEGVKGAVKTYVERFMSQVEELTDNDGKQIILEDWSYQIYQNTEKTCYIPIPLCPENLTPEELEMINGGCIFFSAATFFVTVSVFLFQCVGVATTLAAAAEVAAAAAAVMAGYEVTVAVVVTATVELTGAFVVNYDAAVSGDSWSYEFFHDTAHLY